MRMRKPSFGISSHTFANITRILIYSTNRAEQDMTWNLILKIRYW